MANDVKDEDKRVFEVNEVKYAVIRPSVATLRRGSEMRSKTFNQALENGDILRDQLDDNLRKRNLWNDQKETEYQTLKKSVVDGEFTLSKGGISLQEAKNIALDMRNARNRMVEMLTSRSDLDQNTCEGKADSARFNLLFAECLVYEDTGDPYYEHGLDSYLASIEDEVSTKGATEFYYLLSGTEDLDSTLPENQFLTQYKLVNEDGHLVDKDGRRVDREGRHIDVFGNFIKWQEDDNFIYVDANGREIDVDEGKFKVEFSPFLDEDGTPIVLESESEEKEQAEEEEQAETVEKKTTPKKRAPRKKTTKKKEEPAAEAESPPEEQPEQEAPSE